LDGAVAASARTFEVAEAEHEIELTTTNPSLLSLSSAQALLSRLYERNTQSRVLDVELRADLRDIPARRRRASDLQYSTVAVPSSRSYFMGSGLREGQVRPESVLDEWWD
jgi:hypothetical protein